MDIIHRILSGSPLTPDELRFAGWFVVIWFLMDVIQFVGWIVEKVW